MSDTTSCEACGIDGNSNHGVPDNQALVEACAAWDATTAARLLESGADANGPGSDGRTPFLACFTELTGEQDGLLDGCFTLAKTRCTDWTGALDSCTPAQVDTVAVLLQYGADPWLPCAGGVTPMMAAAACSTHLLQVLLEAGGCQNRGSSSQSGGTQASSQPLGAGPASSGTSTCSNSNTCTTITSEPDADISLKHLMHLACLRGSPDAMQLLLEHKVVTGMRQALFMAVKVSGCTSTDILRHIENVCLRKSRGCSC
jgi:hypothetical protein